MVEVVHRLLRRRTTLPPSLAKAAERQTDAVKAMEEQANVRDPPSPFRYSVCGYADRGDVARGSDNGGIGRHQQRVLLPTVRVGRMAMSETAVPAL
jgi:hypothetical protein